MASHYTRSKARRHGDDVEPDDVSLSDITSDSTFVRPSVEAAGEPGSMSTEVAESVSAPPIFQRNYLPLMVDTV